MKKRIYINMMFLTVISIFIISTALCTAFYKEFSSAIKHEMQDRIKVYSNNSSAAAIDAFSQTDGLYVRITVIKPDGVIAFDNTVQAESMGNHKDREEVSEAFQVGIGESKRFSDTIGKETYYYAITLTDGYVLRAGKTTDSIFSMFAGILPVVAGAFVTVIFIGYFIAGKLTNTIVRPINNVLLDDPISSPYDELAPFIRTITDQRERIEEQISGLKQRSDTISAIMDSMNEGVILVNKQGIILSANKSILQAFDIGETMGNKNILEFFRDIELLSHVRMALAGERGETNFTHFERTYRVYFSPVTDSGAIILFLDITEKAIAETLRKEFSANVSHELKTPLTSIYGNAEMLTSAMVKDSDKQSFYLKIKDEAGRLITLIDDIILISKLDEGSEQETFESVDLSVIANETVESLSRKASDNNISLQMVGDSVQMHANRSQMYELLYNLIDNAIKYNKSGGTINIDLEQRSKHIKLVISDTGIGIPKEAQSRVFERFYRVDKSRSKETGGTGLGLAIVKHIVIVHGGTIELKSKKNEGTNIEIVFEK